jgi:hypothetical protein
MSVRFRDLVAAEYWNLVWPFGLSLIGGCILRVAVPHQPWHSIPPDAVASLADALMVAGILGLMLELFATRLLVTKVSDDLAEKLVGRYLPPALQGYVKGIVDTALVRDHFVKVYKLTLIDGGEKVQLDATVSYEMKNYSDALVDFQPIYQDEDIYKPEFEGMEYGLKGQPRLTETTNEVNADTKVLTVKGKKKIKLQPFRRDSEAVCEVVLRYRLTMPSNYLDVSDFGFATIGATFRTEALPAELEFVSSGYSESSVLPNGDRSWYFNRPFVTGQNIRVWWFTKPIGN